MMVAVQMISASGLRQSHSVSLSSWTGLGAAQRFRLQLALGRGRNMWFTQKFASRHPELAKITSAIAGCSESKWRVRPAGVSCSSDAWGIDSRASFVRFLRSMLVRS